MNVAIAGTPNKLMPFRGATFRGKRRTVVASLPQDDKGKSFWADAEKKSGQLLKKLDEYSRPIAHELDTTAREDAQKILDIFVANKKDKKSTGGEGGEGAGTGNGGGRRIWYSREGGAVVDETDCFPEGFAESTESSSE